MPFSSEEEQNEYFGPHTLDVNKGWGPACHYIPLGQGSSLIKLTIQPENLRTIIRIAIDQVMADALHEFAYCPIDQLIGYNRRILYSIAKSLHLILYAKRFNQDRVFTRNIARVVSTVLPGLGSEARSLTIVQPDQQLNSRVSNYRGQVKRNAANKVEGFYGLLEVGGRVLKVKNLLQKSMYIYPMKKVSC